MFLSICEMCTCLAYVFFVRECCLVLWEVLLPLLCLWLVWCAHVFVVCVSMCVCVCMYIVCCACACMCWCACVSVLVGICVHSTRIDTCVLFFFPGGLNFSLWSAFWMLKRALQRMWCWMKQWQSSPFQLFRRNWKNSENVLWTNTQIFWHEEDSG